MSTHDEEANARPMIRRLARLLALSSHSRNIEAVERAADEIARLTAGVDPSTVNPSSGDFRSGASEALSVLLNAVSEQMISRSTVNLLHRKPRPRVFVAIASSPGMTQKELSEAIGVKESNLSTYIRELAAVGLIEPAAPVSQKGKAWRVAPWGIQTFFQALADLTESVPEEELAHATQALIALRSGVADAPSAGEPETISKEEYYMRLDAALGIETSKPLLLSTFFKGDLREHERPWDLHKRVFERREFNRPLEWIMVLNDATKAWMGELFEAAEGERRLNVYSVTEVLDPVPTVQVLDHEGLFYPLPPGDEGLVKSRSEAIETWESVRAGAVETFVGGRVRTAVRA